MVNAVKRLVGGAVLVAVVTLPGCKSPGYVKASEIQDLVHAVADRHDMYLRADPNVDDATRASELRSTAILRKVVDTAVDVGKPPAPAPAK